MIGQQVNTVGGQHSMVVDESENAFDELLSQLSALNNEIDQELSHSKYPTSLKSSQEPVQSQQSPPPPPPPVHQKAATSDMDYYQHMHHFHHMQQHVLHQHQFYSANAPGGVSQPPSPPTQPAETVVSAVNGTRTDSPDNDSAFSDSISLISTEQSTSSSSSSSVGKSSASSSSSSSSRQAQPPSVLPLPLHPPQNSQLASPTIGPMGECDHQSQSSLSESGSSQAFSDQYSSTNFDSQKRELFFDTAVNSAPSTPSKESSKKKIGDAASRYIKVFAQDNSAKSLMADERMTVGLICTNLAEKNHIPMTMHQSIIEHLPHLYLERFYEDHESLVENVVLWERNSPNKLFFMQRPEKYDIFERPELYLPSTHGQDDPNSTLKSRSAGRGSSTSAMRADLLARLCGADNGGMLKLPEISGNLFLRAEGKKTWKKLFFCLRSSGLYYCAKGKPNSTKDLQCLITFELNCVYFGLGWKKKYKSPTDYGFAIKNPEVQVKSPKHIKYLCAESEDDLRLWINGIRLAKYGRQLLENFERFRSEDHSPKVSNEASNFTGTQSAVMMRANRIQCEEGARISCTSSSSGSVISTPSTGSGNTSVSNVGSGAVMQQFNASPSHSPSGHNSEVQFQSQNHYSQGLYGTTGGTFDGSEVSTIKRRPQTSGSMPKIPLTSTTRNLALQSDDALVEVNENEPEIRSGSAVPTLYEDEIYSSGSEIQHFGRGTLRQGTLRRSFVKAPHSPFTSGQRYSPQQSPPLPPPPPSVIAKASESEDEAPLPPPPPPLESAEMKTSESSHSINQAFPPPPPEVVPLSQLLPIAPRHNAPMTPQPQPKNHANVGRLTRRLSDLSSNSVGFNNWRANGQQQSPNFNDNTAMIYASMQPHSRASIATVDSGCPTTGSITSGHSSSSLNYAGSVNSNNTFATLKAFHTKTSPTSGSPSRLVNGGANKFGTAPRLRGGIDFNEYPPVPAHGAQQPMSPEAHQLPLPPPPSASSNYGPPTVAPPPVPAHARQPSLSSTKESDYSSISPHLIAQQQAMYIQRQHHQAQQQSGGLHSPMTSPSHATIYGAYQPIPQETFLRNMERVMQKKWQVAQMLHPNGEVMSPQPQGIPLPQSPGDILGFRESAYLPPDAPRPNFPAFYAQPPPSPQHSWALHQSHQQHQQPIYSTNQKSVRIADCPPTIIGYGQMPPAGPGQEYSPQAPVLPGSPVHQQAQPIYGINKRVPPPPPKRANSTHLTTNGSQTSLRR